MKEIEVKEIDQKIFDEDKSDYTLVERLEQIDNLISWITECGNGKKQDKVLMKEDLKYLIALDDEYIFSSIHTNEYIANSDDPTEFYDICRDLLEQSGLTREKAEDLLLDDDKEENKKYELIEIFGEFIEHGEKLDGVTVAVGQYDGSFDDDHIFYWFDDYDKVIGEHPDFIVRKYVDSKGFEHPEPKKKVSVRYLKSGAITMFIPEGLSPEEELKYCEDILSVTSDEDLAKGLQERENGFFDETPEIEAIEDVENDYIETYSTSTWEEYTKKPKNTFSVLNRTILDIGSETKELLLDCNADWTPTDFQNGLFFKKETLLQFLQEDYFDEEDKPSKACLDGIKWILADLECNRATMLYLV